MLQPASATAAAQQPPPPPPVATSQRARRGSQATSFDLHFFTDPRCEEGEAPEACKLRTPSAAAIEEAATVVGSPTASWVASSGAAGEKLPAEGDTGNKESRAEDIIYVGRPLPALSSSDSPAC
jgi:hypothetical protein